MLATSVTQGEAMQDDLLKRALDDLDGLLEAHRAMGDDTRVSALRRDPSTVNELRREVASAADAYASALIASAGGELSPERVNACRENAQAAMGAALARRQDLAKLVNQRRLPAPEIREDLRQLVTLSLHCRAAVAALAPTVDRRAADALANQVLVGLREATLRYLASVRDAGDGSTTAARAATLSLLERAEQHANKLSALAPPSDPGEAATLGIALSKDVNALLHRTAHEWGQSDPSDGGK
jgi:hypothetical protein